MIQVALTVARKFSVEWVTENHIEGVIQVLL